MEQYPNFNAPPNPEKKKGLGKITKWIGTAGIAAAAGLGLDKALTPELTSISDEDEKIEAPAEPDQKTPTLQGVPRSYHETEKSEQTEAELPILKFNEPLKLDDQVIASIIEKEIMQTRFLLRGLEYKDELERKGFAEKREQAVNNILKVLKENLEESITNVSDPNIRAQSINHWNLLANFVRGRGYTVSIETPKLP